METVKVNFEQATQSSNSDMKEMKWWRTTGSFPEMATAAEKGNEKNSELDKVQIRQKK